jgi:hypothetical protein
MSREKDRGEWGRVVKQGRDRVDRLPEFLAGRLNWLPHPLPRKGVCTPRIQVGGGTFACREGAGGPNSFDLTDTMVLFIIYVQYLCPCWLRIHAQ